MRKCKFMMQIVGSFGLCIALVAAVMMYLWFYLVNDKTSDLVWFIVAILCFFRVVLYFGQSVQYYRLVKWRWFCIYGRAIEQDLKQK